MLIPGCALPRRLHVDGSHLSVQVLLDRRNTEWLGNMGEIRCYLYPVHSSKSFLITPSLASSMYLSEFELNGHIAYLVSARSLNL